MEAPPKVRSPGVRIVLALACTLAVLASALLVGWTFLVGKIVTQATSPTLVWRTVVHGRTVDELDRPLPGARVVAGYFGDRSVELIPGSRAPVWSDEEGEFVLVCVPGPVTLFARKPGTGSSVPLDLLLVDGRDVTGIELRLECGGRVEGVCTTTDGVPVVGRRIELEEAAYPQWQPEDGIGVTRTDDAGRFAFECVPAVDVRLLASGGPGDYASMARTLAVRRAETTHVSLELKPWQPGERTRGALQPDLR